MKQWHNILLLLLYKYYEDDFFFCNIETEDELIKMIMIILYFCLNKFPFYENICDKISKIDID